MRTLIMIYEKCKISWRKWVSDWCQSAKISRLSDMNRYFIVIIYTYRIVRRRIINGYHENTLQVKEYTLTSKLSLPVRWILHTFSGKKFSILMVAISYSPSNNSIGVNTNNKVPVHTWQPRDFGWLTSLTLTSWFFTFFIDHY